MKRQPEMLLRWNVFEACMIDMLYNNPENYNAPQRLRYIDYLMSATTLRGLNCPIGEKTRLRMRRGMTMKRKPRECFLTIKG